VKTIFLKRHIQKRAWRERSQAGQASIEMVLMLVIGMLIALGMVYRFNVAFKKYTIDMYGTYYRCLLEAGELPGVGAVCGDKKSRFDMANGKDLVTSAPGSAGGGGGGGSGGSGGSGSGGSGNGSGSGKDGKKGSQAGGSGGSGGGSGSGDSGGDGSAESVGGSGRGSGGGSTSVVGRLRNLGKKTRSTAVGRAGGSDKDGGEKGSGAPQISAVSNRSSSDPLKAPRTTMNFQMDGEQYQRTESAVVTPTTATASSTKAAEKGDALRPRKTAENTDRKPAAKALEDKGGSFEFGRIFRMFIIFGIIVAIVVFLGGQVLQISKSGEK
jgi:ubiquitin